MANTTGQKFGGRSKGTPNKTTSEIREIYKELLENNIERLQDDIDSLDPFNRIKVLLELSRFVIPTLKQSELTMEGPQPIFTLNLGSGIKPQDDTRL
jgi:hypothetical protein